LQLKREDAKDKDPFLRAYIECPENCLNEKDALGRKKLSHKCRINLDATFLFLADLFLS